MSTFMDNVVKQSEQCCIKEVKLVWATDHSQKYRRLLRSNMISKPSKFVLYCLKPNRHDICQKKNYTTTIFIRRRSDHCLAFSDCPYSAPRFVFILQTTNTNNTWTAALSNLSQNSINALVSAGQIPSRIDRLTDDSSFRAIDASTICAHTTLRNMTWADEQPWHNSPQETPPPRNNWATIS